MGKEQLPAPAFPNGAGLRGNNNNNGNYYQRRSNHRRHHHHHHGARHSQSSLASFHNTKKLEAVLGWSPEFGAHDEHGHHHPPQQQQPGQAHDRRKRAIQYLEKLAGQWCENVERRQQQQAETTTMRMMESEQHQQEPPVRSFASVLASGLTSQTTTKATATTTTTNTSAAASTTTAAATTKSKPNVWQKPPTPVAAAVQLPTTSTTASNTTTAHKAAAARPAVIPFGSYRLGVEFADSDLDLLVVAPPTVTRDDFFDSFKRLLEQDNCCGHVHAIPTAHVPVLKFEIQVDKEDDVLKVDLVFARVADPTKLVEYHRQKAVTTTTTATDDDGVERYYKIDDSDLEGLDEESVRSLNGARVSQIIMESIPPHCVSTFKVLLRAIRLWAKSRGVYSNILGFLGGINCAILAAYICQKFSNASASDMLYKFFKTFSVWQMHAPVFLDGMLVESPPVTNVARQTKAVPMPAWNPAKYPKDGYHIFPIITPAYPSMNSAYNMGFPQFRRIQDEMRRTLSMLECGNDYDMLLRSSDFFQRHATFLQLSVSAKTEKEFIEWSRFVETKIRILTMCVDNEQVQAWPDARDFQDPRTLSSDENPSLFQRHYYMALRMSRNCVRDKLNVDVSMLAMDFLNQVNVWPSRQLGMDVDLSVIPKKLCPQLVLVRLPQDRDEEINSVSSAETHPNTDDDDDSEDYCTMPRRRTSPKKLRR
jgi:poly(A) polymerase